MIKQAFLAKTSILTAMHETATDLHRLGFIDMHKMRKLDALCTGTISKVVQPAFKPLISPKI